MDESRILARWMSNLRLEEVPESVQEHTARFILDNLGCQLAGAALPWCRTYYDNVICGTRSGRGATLTYYGNELSPDDAAFLNATFNHSNETDDTHIKSPTHAGAIAVPAAMALAQYAGASGRQFLLAVIAAYEVQIRVAWACSPYLIHKGHHPPPAVGPFGGAMAGTVLLGLDAERSLNALAIAGSHAAGLTEYSKTGGSVKRIHCAIPAQAGVRAALFAQRGITGPASILEGEKGFCRVFAGDECDVSRLNEELGERYHLLDNSIKAHSCNHSMHTVLDAVEVIRRDHGVKANEVKAVTVVLNTDWLLSHIGVIVEPKDILGAQFSVAYSVALRLVRGSNGFWDYREEDLANPEMLALAHRVKCVVAAGDDWALIHKGAGVEIETFDGRHLRALVPFPKGMPENPMSREEVIQKFRTLVDPVLPAERSQAIIDAVFDIAGVQDMRKFADLLVVKTPQIRAAE